MEAQLTGFVLHGARILEEDGGFGGPEDVEVRDGVVVARGRQLVKKSGPPVLDGSGLWVLPGMVDCHVHAGVAHADTLRALQTTYSLRVLEAADNVRRILRSGVTLARDAGGLDAGVRDGVARGLLDGPMLKVSIVGLSQTGGHFDGFLQGPGLPSSVEYFMPDYPGRPQFVVDGEQQMRISVRQLLRAGADWIKVATTGGVFGGLEAACSPQLSIAEVQVAVVESAKFGKSVMAHALGGEGIDVALSAGVRSIEHGLLLDERQAQAMAAAGCVLVPTLSAYAAVADRARRAPETLPLGVAAAATEFERQFERTVKLACESGVTIALGSDSAEEGTHGRSLREIALLCRAGMPLEAALLAATRNGAELLGEGSRRGRIASGYQFDAVVLDREPSDPVIFESPATVTGVFRSGRSVLAHPQLADGVSGSQGR